VFVLYRYAGDQVDGVCSVHGINPGTVLLEWSLYSGGALR
jgi:hypothetical protein